ncbi:MAG: hypothetical protein JST42_29910 [Bacteroidetes bacterium]|nr:hypothetical protein [Bacteroidota bacterium]
MKYNNEKLFYIPLFYSGTINDRLGIISAGDKEEKMGGRSWGRHGLRRICSRVGGYRLLAEQLGPRRGAFQTERFAVGVKSVGSDISPAVTYNAN